RHQPDGARCGMHQRDDAGLPGPVLADRCRDGTLQQALRGGGPGMSVPSGAAPRTPLRLARQGLSLLTWLGLAWLLWQGLEWGLWQAVLAPDANQCRALQGQGACWGVIHEKWRPLLFGRYPYEEHWRAALALLLMLGAAGAVLIKPWRWSLRALGLGSFALALLVGGLLHGGVAGLAPVPSDQWGGLPLTLWLAWSTFMLSLPLGIALAWGR